MAELNKEGVPQESIVWSREVAKHKEEAKRLSDLYARIKDAVENAVFTAKFGDQSLTIDEIVAKTTGPYRDNASVGWLDVARYSYKESAAHVKEGSRDLAEIALGVTNEALRLAEDLSSY
jgi:hypothetical protein